MLANTVTLYEDFVEDNRASMETYATNLAKSLKSVARESFEVREYRPLMPAWTLKYKISSAARIRYARYLSYPKQAKKHQEAINHILDQSYAHLLNVLDPARTIVTVHDLIPILGWKGVIPGLSYPHYPLLYKLTIAALRKARAIIAVSECTKRDLVTHCGLKDNDITVIHNGIDDRFRSLPKEERAALRRSFGFPDEGSHIILITGRQSYKNHLTSFRVVAGLQRLTKKPVQLVWLGADNYVYKQCLEQVHLDKTVVRLSNLSVERLVALYNSVDCLLFPSWYEGFGWPPLEAMACGTAVVTSNAGSLPEIVADAALRAPPDDVDRLTEAVRALLEDDNLREDYIQRGYRQASRFTWDRCASKVASLYQQVIDGAI